MSLLAACGGDDVNHLADAPPSTGSDAPTDTPTDGPASLTVTIDGAPVEGVTVHFQNGDGTLISTKTTNANGEASETVHIGAFVTDIDPPIPQVGFGSLPVFNALHTWAGVKPNDHLRLDLRSQLVAGVNVVLADDMQAHYRMFTSCGGDADVSQPSGGSAFAATPAVFTNLPACASQQDLVVVAQDSDFIGVDGLVATDITVAGDSTIDLSAATWKPLKQTDVTFNNIPDTIGDISITAAKVTAKGSVVVDNTGTGNNAGTATVTFGMPDSDTPIAFVGVFAQDTADQSVVTWGPQGDITVDVGASLLKTITDLPGYDTVAHTMTWTEAATGVDADFVRARINVSRSVQADNTIHIWTWDLASPHQAAAVATFPTLPAGDFDFNPASEDDLNVGDLKIAKVPNGYDTVRAVVMNADAPAAVALGASGHAVVEQIGRPTFRKKALQRARAAAKRAPH